MSFNRNLLSSMLDIEALRSRLDPAETATIDETDQPVDFLDDVRGRGNALFSRMNFLGYPDSHVHLLMPIGIAPVYSLAN